MSKNKRKTKRGKKRSKKSGKLAVKKKFSAAINKLHRLKCRIYVNNDSSFLVRKEELRLRQVLKKLKDDNPNVQSYTAQQSKLTT